jgi:DNA-binding transcriptional regulator YiaG
MEWRVHKHTQRVGAVAVHDATAFAWQCTQCGEVDLSLEDLAGYERRAAALVLRDGRHVNGDVLRAARKALDLRQADLAALLGCQPETISRWETGAMSMPRAEQLALVALLDGTEQGTMDLDAQLQGASKSALDNGEELEVRLPRRATG